MSVPYSVKSLASRWDCSEGHIRHMIAAGKLRAFSLGDKLLRISAEEVQRIEGAECQTIASPGTGESSQPCGTERTVRDTAIRSARLINPLPPPALPNLLAFTRSKSRERP